MFVKKILSLVLAFVLVGFTLTACAPQETEPSGTVGEEMSYITVSSYVLKEIPAAAQQSIEDAVNALTEPKINVHVDLQFYTAGAYGARISLAMAGKETIDLVTMTPIPAVSYNSLFAQGQLKDMTPYLQQGTLDLLGDLILGTTAPDGKTYATTNYRVLSSDAWILMRQDILDELGLTEQARNMKSWSDYEALLEQVVAQKDISGVCSGDLEGTVVPIGGFNMGVGDFSDVEVFDVLGDAYKLIGVDSKTNKVYSFFESADYKSVLEMTQRWYEKGLIYRDSATKEELGDALLGSGVTFSTISQGEEGVAEERSAKLGVPILGVKIATGMLSTSSLDKFCFGIPITAEEPEAAGKYLNMMYTDPELCNLLAWGIEGRDYVANAEGEAEYPAGVTADTVTYHAAPFLFANAFLTLPWQGQGGDFRTRTEQILKDSPRSQYLGFATDTTSISAELTALYAVEQQYKPGLESGSDNVATDLPAFIAALKANGIDKVVETYQEQLDAWLAKQ